MYLERARSELELVAVRSRHLFKKKNICRSLARYRPCVSGLPTQASDVVDAEEIFYPYHGECSAEQRVRFEYVDNCKNVDNLSSAQQSPVDKAFDCCQTAFAGRYPLRPLHKSRVE